MTLLSNNFGNRLSNFRANVINPDVIQDQAISGVEGELRARGAKMSPDFAQVFELISKDPMHTFDKRVDVQGLQQLQTDFLDRVSRDPFIMFTPEGRQLSRQVTNFLQDPERIRRVENFQFNKESIERASKDKILSDVFVSGGVVGGENELFGTVANQWQVIDNMTGGSQRLNITQNSFGKAKKNIEESLAKAGKIKTTDFIGLNTGAETIERVITSDNNQQLAILIEGMVDKGMIDGSDYDAFLSRAAKDVMTEAANQGVQLNREETQIRAEARLVDMVRNLAKGQREFLQTKSLSQNPTLSGLGGGSTAKTGPITAMLLNKNHTVNFQSNAVNEDGVPIATRIAFPASQIDTATMWKQNLNTGAGNKNLRENQLMSLLGGTNRNIMSIGAPGERNVPLSFEARDFLVRRGIITSPVSFADVPITSSGQMLTADQLASISNIQTRTDLSPAEKQQMFRQIGYTGQTQEHLIYEIEVGFEDGVFGGDDEDFIDQFEETGIGSIEEFRTEDEANQYKYDLGGVQNDNINSGSKRYRVTVTVPTDPNKTAAIISGYEGKTITVPSSFSLFNSPTSAGPRVVNPGFANFEDIE